MWRVTRKQIMKANEFKQCVPYTTKSGLQIGIAYIPPAQQLTLEGEQIQSILLGQRTSFIDRRGLMVYAVIVAAVFVTLAVVVGK
jgi:hypothetical protein